MTAKNIYIYFAAVYKLLNHHTMYFHVHYLFIITAHQSASV